MVICCLFVAKETTNYHKVAKQSKQILNSHKDAKQPQWEMTTRMTTQDSEGPHTGTKWPQIAWRWPGGDKTAAKTFRRHKKFFADCVGGRRQTERPCSLRWSMLSELEVSERAAGSLVSCSLTFCLRWDSAAPHDGATIACSSKFSLLLPAEFLLKTPKMFTVRFWISP